MPARICTSETGHQETSFSVLLKYEPHIRDWIWNLEFGNSSLYTLVYSRNQTYEKSTDLTIF